MSEQIKIVETRSWKGRVVVILLLVAALVFAWLSISWQLGNMFAALTPANQPNAKSIAEFAHGLSPRDPITNWLKASIEKDTFSPQSLEKSVASLEEAVRYAPEDYRYWLELARACEQIENYERAEKAYRRAVAIAPNYSNVHWQVGNFYLRRGSEADAFSALGKSAETSAVYREQVFSVVWEYYEKDKSKIEQLAGEKPDMRAGLAKFYAAKELPEDSLRIWNTLSDEDKTRNQDIARLIAQALHDKRFYRSSIEFVRQLGIEPLARRETVQNGGFEMPIADAKDTFFGWVYTRKEKIEINTDPMKKKEGNKSLRFNFNGFSGIEIKNFLQIVTVEANKKYRLSFWLKTENLKSAGTPWFEIVNANDEKIIKIPEQSFPSGTQDWTLTTVEFTAPPNAQAVAIRLDRSYCGDACPIVGTFWVDDFKLEAL